MSRAYPYGGDMCGRYAATAKPGELVEEYEIDFVDDLGPAASPRWNIAPTMPIATVLVDDRDGHETRLLTATRWGLIPPWAKERPMQLINARVETVAEKPSFRNAIRRRRCIVPADGYYEWRAEGGRKQPYWLQGATGTLALAGIFEFHRFDDLWVRTTAILTTEATDEFGWVHDRMPLVVHADSRDAWLDPTSTDPVEALAGLEEPRLLRATAVTTAVNKVGNEGPELLTPVGE